MAETQDEWGRPMVACKWCGAPTAMTGTKMCDGCWELERRISRAPDLARRMLAEHEVADVRGVPPPPTSWAEGWDGRDKEAFQRALESTRAGGHADQHEAARRPSAPTKILTNKGNE